MSNICRSLKGNEWFLLFGTIISFIHNIDCHYSLTFPQYGIIVYYISICVLNEMPKSL